MKNQDSIYFDLRLDSTYLNSSEEASLIQASLSDEFSVIALSKTCTPSQIPKINIQQSKFDQKKLLLLSRITLLVSSEEDIEKSKTLVSSMSSPFDLIAFEFSSSNLLESFLKNATFPGDNLISINLSSFIVPSSVLKTLMSRPYFVEICYSHLLDEDPEKRKKALLNFSKIMEGHFKNIILSSNASSVYERRNVREVKEIVRGLTEGESGSKLKAVRRFEEMCWEHPKEVVLRARMRREGFANVVKKS